MIKVIALIIHILFPDGDMHLITELHQSNGGTLHTRETCTADAPLMLDTFKREYSQAQVAVLCEEIEIKAPGSTL